jgi:hypothetical protein
MSNRSVETLPGPMVVGAKTLPKVGTGDWAWAGAATTRTVTIATPVSAERHLFEPVLVMWVPPGVSWHRVVVFGGPIGLHKDNGSPSRSLGGRPVRAE